MIGTALAIVVATGSASWALVSHQHNSTLKIERDSALAELAQIKAATAQLAQIEARLGSARMEYGKVVQSWAEARAKLGGTQQELAALTKRLDQSRDRVSQTGSIRPVDTSKRPPLKR